MFIRWMDVVVVPTGNRIRPIPAEFAAIIVTLLDLDLAEPALMPHPLPDQEATNLPVVRGQELLVSWWNFRNLLDSTGIRLRFVPPISLRGPLGTVISGPLGTGPSLTGPLGTGITCGRLFLYACHHIRWLLGRCGGTVHLSTLQRPLR